MKIRRSICISSLLLSLFSMTVSAADEKVAVISFNQGATDEVIKVIKKDNRRNFVKCANIKTEVENCKSLSSVKVDQFNDVEGLLDSEEGFFGQVFSTEWLPEGAGAISGFLIGANRATEYMLGHAYLERGNIVIQNEKRVMLIAKIIQFGAAVAGFMIGDYLDGYEFSALETLAVKTTLLDSLVLDGELEGTKSLDLEIDEYIELLNVAMEAVSAE